MFCPRRSQRADAPLCMHFPTDICCVIQEGVISVQKSVCTKARQCIGSATCCHLDKTNMDKTSQHPQGNLHLGVKSGGGWDLRYGSMGLLQYMYQYVDFQQGSRVGLTEWSQLLQAGPYSLEQGWDLHTAECPWDLPKGARVGRTTISAGGVMVPKD